MHVRRLFAMPNMHVRRLFGIASSSCVPVARGTKPYALLAAKPALAVHDLALCNFPPQLDNIRGLCNMVSSAPFIQAAASQRPALPPSRFAIVVISGSQHKVVTDALICVEKMNLAVGTQLMLRRILLVGWQCKTIVGSPLVTDAAVAVTVEEQGHGPKIIVFKKKRRKGYRRWCGFRSRLTLLRVDSVEMRGESLPEIRPRVEPCASDLVRRGGGS